MNIIKLCIDAAETALYNDTRPFLSISGYASSENSYTMKAGLFNQKYLTIKAAYVDGNIIITKMEA